MPAVARGDGVDSVHSACGTGVNCASPMTTATNECSGDVITNDIGTVRKGDVVQPHPKIGCGTDMDTAVISTHSPDVFVNDMNMARVGDKYLSPENTITSGSGNVFCNS